MNENPKKGIIYNPYTLANTVIANLLDDATGASGDRVVNQIARPSRSRVRGVGFRDLSPSPQRPAPLVWEYISESDSDGDDETNQMEPKNFSVAPSGNTSSENA